MERIIINKKFSRAVWFTGLLLAPAIMIVFFAIRAGDMSGLLVVYGVCLVIFTALSLPAIIIYSLAHKKLSLTVESELVLKLLLIGITTTLLALAFYVMSRFDRTDFGTDAWICCGALVATIAIATFIYKPRLGEAMPVVK